MPEYRECTGHGQTGHVYLQILQKDPNGCHLQGLWGDTTTVEDAKGKRVIPHVIPFLHGCKSARGNPNQRGLVIPSELAKKAVSIKDLGWVLQKVLYDPRTIVLCFGDRYLKLAFLTHTSMQLYPRNMWENTVMTTEKTERFKVGLALEFLHHIWSFNSRDLVFKPTWVKFAPMELYIKDERRRYDLGRDVFFQFSLFLQDLVRWRSERMSGSRTGLAMKVIRNADGTPFYGLGVYTASEVFSKAGIPLDAKEKDVFDDPSSTGRLCEAWWTWAYQSQGVFKTYIRSAMDKKTNIIGPSDAHRQRVVTDLDVYGKDTANVPPRMLLINGGSDWQARGKFHLFDPVFIADGLQCVDEVKEISLGPIIFGLSEWRRLNPSAPDPNDPLTLSFIAEGKWSSTWIPSNLNLQAYKAEGASIGDAIILRPGEVRRWKKARVFFYKEDSQMWTITRLDTLPPRVTQPSESERENALFKNIISNKNDVAIGVLEYAGHAKSLNTPHGEKMIPTRGDPTLSEYQCKLSLLDKTAGKGTRKVKLSSAEQARLNQKVAKIKAAGPSTPVTGKRKEASFTPTAPLQVYPYPLALLPSPYIRTPERVKRARQWEDSQLPIPVVQRKRYGIDLAMQRDVARGSTSKDILYHRAPSRRPKCSSSP
ncbi:hypothetical protein D9611_004821 [Ephemerocybe angulata]|uniref:Uncharacterized protein n=1 Tax=Ephemerocybe angulata TaxID=980116 RepID=A0A8H5B3K5_9AGAR|nr:hypothetical protein D9611_004821 [Tulosesus angulatus]